jgi:hypothetical protein
MGAVESSEERRWSLGLEGMPGADEAMKRVEAWFDGAVLDRPPVRFSKHNAQYEEAEPFRPDGRWGSLRERWMDAEYQVDSYLESIEGQSFRAETFPEYWPNLGPEIYAAYFGAELEFGEVTAWTSPLIRDLSSFDAFDELRLDRSNPYYKKIREMTSLALEKCRGKALVGATCLGPGIDCVAAWLEPQELCVDMMLEPDKVKRLLDRTLPDFFEVYDELYEEFLQARNPSIGWMGIPSFGKGHIIQADFSNMISPGQFAEFCLPWIEREAAHMDRSIFHMDGKGVARHVDRLLELESIDAIQWVQGVGDDEPILQWLPLIRRIQEAGTSVVLDLKPSELEGLIEGLEPEGLFLCIAAPDGIQDDILRRVARW